MWSLFAVDLERLADWIASIPDWTKPVAILSMNGKQAKPTIGEDTGKFSISALGTLWAAAELERAAGDDIMVVEDRVRLDPVTLLVHHLGRQRFAGLHLRTAIFNETRRIHFDVKRPHFFVDPDLWVLLVLLRPDRNIHDFCLLIPSTDLPELGYSETMTLDPLTKRFREYRVPADEFGSMFMKAFGTRRQQTSTVDGAISLKMAG